MPLLGVLESNVLVQRELPLLLVLGIPPAQDSAPGHLRRQKAFGNFLYLLIIAEASSMALMMC